MDTLSAFVRGMANRGKERMVFDWEKAARLIKEKNGNYAEAWLDSDREWTGGVILEDGNPVKDDYTYLASTWATPMIEIDGITQECYRMESEVPGWDAGTKWPPEALKILMVE